MDGGIISALWPKNPEQVTLGMQGEESLPQGGTQPFNEINGLLRAAFLFFQRMT